MSESFTATTLVPMIPKVRAVLDTNVILGWLLFRDDSCVTIGNAIGSGQLTWLAGGSLRDELAHVLARGIRGWSTDANQILASFDQHATIVATVRVDVTPHRLRCTDRDDQKFIDLALASSADVLLSRDRAVLKLARRATSHGLIIATPGSWLADAATQRKRAAEAAL